MERKTIRWIFQATNKWKLTQENLDITNKGKPLQKIWTLLIAAQNNAIRTNYVKEG